MHTSTYGSPEAVAREKRALLERLGPEGVAVVNADDPLALATARGLPCRVVTAGHAAEADVRLADARSAWPEGYEVRLQCHGEQVSATIGLHAEHLAPLVALALAAAHVLGVEPDAALAAAARWFVMPEGRLRPERGPTGSTFLMDDFKSRPSGAVVALRALRASPARRRIAVLGEVDENPERESNYRDSARLLPGCADLVFAIGRAAPHIRKLLAGTELADGVRLFDGFADAAEALRKELAEGDVVLIHGCTAQHLGRIKLLLDGRTVGCRVRRCSLGWLCTDCPHLDSHPPEGVVLAGPS